MRHLFLIDAQQNSKQKIRNKSAVVPKVYVFYIKINFIIYKVATIFNKRLTNLRKTTKAEH